MTDPNDLLSGIEDLITAPQQSAAPTPNGNGGDLRAKARSYAQKYNVDPDIFERQIQQESGFKRFAKSPKGALGIAQFMPATGKRYGLNNAKDLFDPDKSLDASARHMSDMLKKYNGDYDKALASYNAGEGAVDKYKGVPPFKETQHYVKTVRGNYQAPQAAPDLLSGIEDLIQAPGAPPAAAEGAAPDLLSGIEDLVQGAQSPAQSPTVANIPATEITNPAEAMAGPPQDPLASLIQATVGAQGQQPIAGQGIGMPPPPLDPGAPLPLPGAGLMDALSAALGQQGKDAANLIMSDNLPGGPPPPIEVYGQPAPEEAPRQVDLTSKKGIEGERKTVHETMTGLHKEGEGLSKQVETLNARQKEYKARSETLKAEKADLERRQQAGETGPDFQSEIDAFNQRGQALSDEATKAGEEGKKWDAAHKDWQARGEKATAQQKVLQEGIDKYNKSLPRTHNPGHPQAPKAQLNTLTEEERQQFETLKGEIYKSDAGSAERASAVKVANVYARGLKERYGKTLEIGGGENPYIRSTQATLAPHPQAAKKLKEADTLEAEVKGRYEGMDKAAKMRRASLDRGEITQEQFDKDSEKAAATHISLQLQKDQATHLREEAIGITPQPTPLERSVIRREFLRRGQEPVKYTGLRELPKDAKPEDVQAALSHLKTQIESKEDLLKQVMSTMGEAEGLPNQQANLADKVQTVGETLAAGAFGTLTGSTKDERSPSQRTREGIEKGLNDLHSEILSMKSALARLTEEATTGVKRAPDSFEQIGFKASAARAVRKTETDLFKEDPGIASTLLAKAMNLTRVMDPFIKGGSIALEIEKRGGGGAITDVLKYIADIDDRAHRIFEQQVVGDTISGIGAAWDLATDNPFSSEPSGPSVIGRGFAMAGHQMNEAIKKETPFVDEKATDVVRTTILPAVVSSAAFMVGGEMGAALGMGPKAARILSSMLSQAGGGYEQALAEGLSPTQARMQAATQAASGISEELGLNPELFGKIAREGWKGGLKAIGHEVLEEVVQETGFGQLMPNYFTKLGVDPDHSITEGFSDAAVGAIAVSLLMGGGGHVIQHLGKPKAKEEGPRLGRNLLGDEGQVSKIYTLRTEDGRTGIVTIDRKGQSTFKEVKTAGRTGAQDDIQVPADHFEAMFPGKDQKMIPGAVDMERYIFLANQIKGETTDATQDGERQSDHPGELQGVGRGGDVSTDETEIRGEEGQRPASSNSDGPGPEVQEKVTPDLMAKLRETGLTDKQIMKLSPVEVQKQYAAAIRQTRKAGEAAQRVENVQKAKAKVAKAQFLNEAKAGTSFEESKTGKANIQAHEAAETGKPLEIVGFRQQRKGVEQTAGTGTFYAVRPEMAASYADEGTEDPTGGNAATLKVEPLSFKQVLKIPSRPSFIGDPQEYLRPEDEKITENEKRRLQEPQSFTTNDRRLARIVLKRGYDAIVHAGGEIQDLRGMKAEDIDAQMDRAADPDEHDYAVDKPKEAKKPASHREAVTQMLTAQGHKVTGKAAGKLEQRDALSTSETSQVNKKFDELKAEAKKNRKTVDSTVKAYLGQGGLFGQELSDDQQAMLRDLAAPQARRAPVAEKQGGLFDTAPTVESREEQRAQPQERAKSPLEIHAAKVEQIKADAKEKVGRSKLDLLLDRVKPGEREVTLDVREFTPEQQQQVIDTAKARGLDASSDGRNILVRDLSKLKEETKTKVAAIKEDAKAKVEAKKGDIQDVGQKIGGARKDKWAERGLTLQDLEGMTGGEEAAFVTKANIWKPNYAAMVEAGADPKAAALLKVVYDQLGAKPRSDTPEGRRQYLEMMGYFKEAYANVKTEADVKAAFDALHEKINWNNAATRKRDVGFSVWKGRSNPFQIQYAERRRADNLVEAGFPAAQEPWTRRYMIRSEELSLTQHAAEVYAKRAFASDDAWVKEFATEKELAEKFMEAGGVWTVREKKSLRPLTWRPDEASATTAARELYGDLKGKTKEEGNLPERPHLDFLKREGADIRGGRNVEAEDFRKAFGFRGVEFGNWAASDERQSHLNQAFEALHDMAEALGIPPKAVSLNGTLGLAFGARGSGAAAHYESSKIVINLAKKSGPGALAHEWGHAVDHYFGELNRPDAYTAKARGASGWYEKATYSGKTIPRQIQNAEGKYQKVEQFRLANLRPEVAKAFDGVMSALFERDKTRAEAIRAAELTLEETKAAIEKYTTALDEAKERPVDQHNKKWIRQVVDHLAMLKRRAELNGARIAAVNKEEKPEGGYGNVETSYSESATALSGKSGDYWKRPTEMFARSFEAYVFDKLGRKSQYLVHGVEGGVFTKEKGYKGDPYPAGAEREAINKAYDELFKVIESKETPTGQALYQRDYEDMSLSEFVRHLGGFKQDENLVDRQRVSQSQIGSSGLISTQPGKGLTPDGMQQAVREEGYQVPDNLGAFMEAVGADAVARQLGREHGKDIIRHPGFSYDAEIDRELEARESGIDVEDIWDHRRIHDKALHNAAWVKLWEKVNHEETAPTRNAIAAFRKLSREFKITEASIQSIIEAGEYGRSSDAYTFGGESDFIPPQREAPTSGEDRRRAAEAARAAAADQGGTADEYAQIPARDIAPNLRAPLLQIARDFIKSGSTDYAALLKHYESFLGSDYAKAAPHIPVIIEHAETAPEDVAAKTTEAPAQERKDLTPRNRNEFEHALLNAGLAPNAESAQHSARVMEAMATQYGHDLHAADPSISVAEGKKRAYAQVRVGWAKEVAGGLEQGIADPFYSHLGRTIEQQTQGRFTPEQLEAVLKKAGVKPDEMKWTGFDDFIAQKKEAGEKITKEEAQKFARENAVQVREVMKGGAESEIKRITQEMKDLRFEIGDGSKAERRWDELEAERKNVRDASPTKFNRPDLLLPGGENYRELLLMLPEGAPTVADVLKRDGFIDASNKNDAPPVYSSSHYDEPNILAHIRFNERTDADGKKVLFVEEIQSDWHQTGRKKGYGPRITVITKTSIRKGIFDSQKEADEFIANSGRSDLSTIREPGGQGVPDAPFKKTWHELALKRVIRYAAEKGFDKVAWTTGEQQAERYDLSKHISGVDWTQDTADGTFALNIHDLDRNPVHVPNVDMRRMSLSDIEDVLGKDIAEKIKTAAETQRPEERTTIKSGPHHFRPNKTIYWMEDARGYHLTGDEESPEAVRSTREWHERYDKASPSGRLEGLDLKVGGEGMKGFYDKILPEAANKLGKKFGARVGQTKIETDADAISEVRPGAWRIVRNGTFEGGVYDSIEAARRDARADSSSVHSMDITDSMRSSAMEGQPLFQAAWHGTPHKFDQFTTDHMGSGESVISKYLEGYKDHPDGRRNRMRNTVLKQRALYAEAVDRYLNGESLRSIADSLGKEHKPLAQALRDFGVDIREKKRIDDEVSHQLVQRHEQGESLSSLGAAYGLTPSSVKDHLNNRGIDTAATPLLSSDDKKAIRDLYEQETPVAEIASLYDISTATVKRAVDEIGGKLRTQAQSQAIAVQRYGVNVSGANIPFQSKKGNRWLLADSTYEVARFIELENDDTVAEYSKAPPKVEYNEGRNVYSPDIWVAYKDGHTAVEEIKSKWQLDFAAKVDAAVEKGQSISDIAKDMSLSEGFVGKLHKLNTKLAEAKKFFAAQDIDFRILTENDLSASARKESDYSSHTKLSESERRALNKARRKVIGLNQEARAATHFAQSGEAIISALQNPNESSALHEMMHAVAPMFLKLAAAPNAPANLVQSMKSFEKFMDLNPGEFLGLHDSWIAGNQSQEEGDRYRDAQEKLARGFENYLREGVAPTKALETAFKSFKEWLSRIYEGIKSIAGVKINPEIRSAFDRMLGAEREGTAQADEVRDTSGERKERSMPKTLREQGMEPGYDLEYDVIGNKDSHAKAEKNIRDKGLDGAREWILTTEEPSAELTATAIVTMQQYQERAERLSERGDRDGAIEAHTRQAEVASDISEKLTRFGQAIQAVQILTRMKGLAPENVLMTATKVVKRGNPDGKLTGEQAQEFMELAKATKKIQDQLDATLKHVRDLESQLKKRPAPAPRVPKPKARTWEDVSDDALVAREAAAQARIDALMGGARLEQRDDQTQTAKFKKWFGKSQVVDAKGKPLVVYHGSRKNFDAFSKERRGEFTGANSAQLGFFFTSSQEVASSYPDAEDEARQFDSLPLVSGLQNAEDNLERHEEVTQAFARFDKDEDGWEAMVRTHDEWGVQYEYEADRLIHDTEEEATEAAEEEVAREREKLEKRVTEAQVKFDKRREEYAQGSNVMPAFLKLENPLIHDFAGGTFREQSFSQLLEEAEEEGHDGAIFENVDDSKYGGIASDVYIVFEPTQIKSATGNRGTFDAKDPNILHQETQTPSIQSDLAAILASQINKADRKKTGKTAATIFNDLLSKYPAQVKGHEDVIRAEATEILKSVRKAALLETAKTPEGRVSARQELARDVKAAAKRDRQASTAKTKKELREARDARAEAEGVDREAARARLRQINAAQREERRAIGKEARARLKEAQKEAGIREKQQALAARSYKKAKELEMSDARANEQADIREGLHEKKAAEKAQARQIEKEARESAERSAAAERDRQNQETKRIAQEARDRLKASNKSAREARKAEFKKIRAQRAEGKKADLKAAREQGKWDAGLQADAEANPKDMIAVAAAKIARIAGGELSPTYQDFMKAQFPGADSKTLGDVYLTAWVKMDTARKAGKEAAEIKRATAGESGAMTDEQIAGLRQQLKDLDAKTKALTKEKAKAMGELTQAFKNLTATGFWRTALTWWKAGLFGLKTHGRNVGGNLGYAGFTETALVPGSLADMVAGAVNYAKGKGYTRALMGPSATAMYDSTRFAATVGLSEGWQILKHGATLEQMEKQQFYAEAHSKNPAVNAINKLANMSFRLMGAEDRVFYNGHLRRNLLGRAKAQAVNEHRADSAVDVKARTKELADNPSEQLMADAKMDALEATFNNNNRISKGLASFKKELGGYSVLLDFVIPFDRTPTNIFIRMLEASPVGLVISAGQISKALAKDGFTSEQQRKFAKTFGRSSLGTGILALGWILASMGLATGPADDDEGRRERDKAAGRKPGAIRIFGTWYQVGSFSPMGNLLSIGAGLYREAKQTRTEWYQGLTHMAALGGKALLELPMLQGAKGVLDTLQAPGGSKTTSGGGRFAASFVPTLLSDLAELGDTKTRDPKGFLQQIQKRIPGLRNLLPEATDVLGRPVDQSKSAAYNPTLPSKGKELTDPVDRELLRLDVGVSKPDIKAGETEDAYRERSKSTGQKVYAVIDRVIQTPAYQKLTDEEKGDKLKKVIVNAHLSGGHVKDSPEEKARLDKAAKEANPRETDTERKLRVKSDDAQATFVEELESRDEFGKLGEVGQAHARHAAGELFSKYTPNKKQQAQSDEARDKSAGRLDQVLDAVIERSLPKQFKTILAEAKEAEEKAAKAQAAEEKQNRSPERRTASAAPGRPKPKGLLDEILQR